MKKCNIEGFDFARRFVEGLIPEHKEFVPDRTPVPSSSTDNLLSVIYSVDPLTNAPSGDIQYLISDKANPQIKQFILDNLMMDVSSMKQPAVPAVNGVSDDVMLQLSRNAGESLDSYVARLNTQIERDVWTVKTIKQGDVSTQPVTTPVSSE